MPRRTLTMSPITGHACLRKEFGQGFPTLLSGRSGQPPSRSLLLKFRTLPIDSKVRRSMRSGGVFEPGL
jgi:hypothetical protein